MKILVQHQKIDSQHVLNSNLLLLNSFQHVSMVKIHLLKGVLLKVGGTELPPASPRDEQIDALANLGGLLLESCPHLFPSFAANAAAACSILPWEF